MPIPLIVGAIVAGGTLVGTKTGRKIIKTVGETAYEVGKWGINKAHIYTVESTLDLCDDSGIRLNGMKTKSFKSGVFSESKPITANSNICDIFNGPGLYLFAVSDEKHIISKSRYLFVNIAEDPVSMLNKAESYIKRIIKDKQDVALTLHYTFFGSDEDFSIKNKNYDSNNPNSQEYRKITKKNILYALASLLTYKFTRN